MLSRFRSSIILVPQNRPTFLPARQAEGRERIEPCYEGGGDKNCRLKKVAATASGGVNNSQRNIGAAHTTYVFSHAYNELFSFLVRRIRSDAPDCCKGKPCDAMH